MLLFWEREQHEEHCILPRLIKTKLFFFLVTRVFFYHWNAPFILHPLFYGFIIIFSLEYAYLLLIYYYRIVYCLTFKRLMSGWKLITRSKNKRAKVAFTFIVDTATCSSTLHCAINEKWYIIVLVVCKCIHQVNCNRLCDFFMALYLSARDGFVTSWGK